MLKLPGHPEIGAQERGSQLRNQFLRRIGLIPEPPAERPGQPALMARPMANLMQGRRVIMLA